MTAAHTQEEIVCIGTVTSDSEDLDEVEELPMDVSDNGYGGADMDDVALTHEQLLRLCAYCFDDRLGEKFFLVEARDTLVQIDGC